jgi:hypothetical protein
MGKLKKLGKKIWKGIKKVGSKIGRGFKKAFKGVGKAFGKLGPLGTIAMMFILPGLGAAIWNGLGSMLGTAGGTAVQAGAAEAAAVEASLGAEAAKTAAGKVATTAAKKAATETAKQAAMDSAKKIALEQGLGGEAASIAAQRAGEAAMTQSSGMLASSNAFIKGFGKTMKFTYDGIGKVGTIAGNVTDAITGTFSKIGGGHVSEAFNNIRQWMGMEPTGIDIASDTELLEHADSIDNLKQIEGLGNRAYKNALKIDTKNLEQAKWAKQDFYNRIGVDEKVFSNLEGKELYNEVYTNNPILMKDGKLTQLGSQLTSNNKMLHDMHAQGRAIYSQTGGVANYNQEFLPTFEKKYASTYKPVDYSYVQKEGLGRAELKGELETSLFDRDVPVSDVTQSFEEFGNELLTSTSSSFNPTTKFGKGMGTKYDTFMDTDNLLVQEQSDLLGRLNYGDYEGAPNKTWAGANPYGAAGAKTTEAVAFDAAQTAIFGEVPDLSIGTGTVAERAIEEEGIAYTLAEQEYKQSFDAQMASLGFDINLLEMRELLGIQDGLWGGGTFSYQAELAKL